MLVVDAIKYRNEMVATARGYVGDAAEDVVQETMEYLLRAKIPTTDKTPLRLLNHYVKNRCISYIRRQKTQRNIKEGYRYGHDGERTLTGLDEDVIEKMLDAVEKLHPYARSLLILRYVDGMKTTEIAKETGIKLDRIRRVITCSKQILKAHVKQRN